MADWDKLTEKLARGVARGSSRRSMLAWLGSAVTGAALIPVLPVSRAYASSGDPHAGSPGRPPVTSGNPQDPGDRTQCDYWRYCAIDGFLCGEQLSTRHGNVSDHMDWYLH